MQRFASFCRDLLAMKMPYGQNEQNNERRRTLKTRQDGHLTNAMDQLGNGYGSPGLLMPNDFQLLSAPVPCSASLVFIQHPELLQAP